MPLIKCVADYRNGPVFWHAGKEDSVTDDEAEFLLRDSPGSFVLTSDTTSSPSNPDVDLSGMSTENAWGNIPDRRARGGRSRAG